MVGKGSVMKKSIELSNYDLHLPGTNVLKAVQPDEVQDYLN